MSGTHGHVFLELCCASDSELAAAVVEHCVAIRVTSSEDLQLVSTRRVLHRLLRICKAKDVVVFIWVSIETGDVGQQFGDCEGERVISLYTNKSLRSVGTDRRDGASWIDLQDGFSSGCRDPATTAAIDDLTVLRTPKREWKYPCFGRLRLSLHSLNGIIVIR